MFKFHLNRSNLQPSSKKQHILGDCRQNMYEPAINITGIENEDKVLAQKK